jgi:glycosyltransferase involved in cell wall biosynthesis
MPILSICIPTYNRATVLIQTLNSIVSQKIFIETDLVEIVVRDNCSEDNTRECVLSYVSKFPNKIKYFKNEINFLDGNYDIVLNDGTGSYLKLNNDTLVHHQNSLEFLLTAIEKYQHNGCQLLFTNSANGLIAEVNSLDELANNFRFINYMDWNFWHMEK